ncbi:pilus assembly PilX N-terminal domain-containing protein [Desulfobacula phenolica]|uniref:Type 4 fimbrial biogenesis protein PilX N-terminal domain-containing protein n=1 Tax=Desulfobacula phenolica TaxID=90732 RepID=A0A1H2EXT8_9BACT|nr:pilus assembly PilX N-terminal domain-containing protein [Desulfobacula phenolica]SDT99942.1 hypothetical protein SAMN04487931_103425 [Desulfobacula phenolica]
MWKSSISNNNGSILAIAMFCLLILSIFGTFALNTSDYEISIAANQQRWEKNFNASEGGANREGSGVGYAGVNGLYSWYTIADPETYNTHLYPSTLANYDPSGTDMPVAGTFPDNFDADDPNSWPRQNLMNDTTDNDYDYAYLVTYLYPDVPPKGMDATKFSSYKFRINGQRQVIIEIGGIKVGVINPL